MVSEAPAGRDLQPTKEVQLHSAAIINARVVSPGFLQVWHRQIYVFVPKARDLRKPRRRILTRDTMRAGSVAAERHTESDPHLLYQLIERSECRIAEP